MTIRNRELSQFASFTFVDNVSKNIGLSTVSDEFMGIGTTTPLDKFHVNGNSYLQGNLTVTGNANLGNLNINTTGIITAFTFYTTKSGLAELVNPTQDRWQSDGTDIYRITDNVGIGISNISEKLEVIGNIKGTQFISTVSTGTAPLIISSQTVVQNLNADRLRGGIPGGNVSGDIATVDGVQELTNKTLTLPEITNPTISGVIFYDGAGGPYNISFPNQSGTLITNNDTETVTSQMIANNSIVNNDINTNAAIVYSKLNLNNSITNSDIAANANIANSKLQNFTISGVSLGSSLAALTINSNYLTGTSYNGSVAIGISVKASSNNTASFIVARDSQGNFNANTINLSQDLNVLSGEITARDFTVTNTFNASGDIIIESGNYLIGQVPILHLQDQKADGVVGGAATSGSWIRRTLNTSVNNTISGASLSSNLITLPAGTYEIEASAPGYQVDSHQVRFFSNTQGIIIYGTCEFANPSSGLEFELVLKAEGMTRSYVRGRFTINSTVSDFELQHQVATSKTNDGFGLPCSFGGVEVYSDIYIKRIG